MQAGMVFHQQVDPKADCYLQQFIGTLRGAVIEAPALADAWRRLVRRHQSMRTAFRWSPQGRLLQDVYHFAELPVLILDWQDLEHNDCEMLFQDLIEEERCLSFDLTVPPLHRIIICKEEQRSGRLIWTSHHALIDGRSRVLLLDELLAIYDKLCKGEEPMLPPAPSWADYSRWRSQQDLSGAEFFWRRKLEGVRPTTLMPAGSPGDLHNDGDIFGNRESALSGDSWTCLSALCRDYGTTATALIHGVWAIVLAGIAGANEVVFGAVRACRHAGFPEEGGLAGLLINTLPVRVNINGDKALGSWLQELHSEWIDLRPFELTALPDALRWAGTPSGQALFNTIVSIDDRRLEENLQKRNGVLTIADFHVRAPSHFDLAIHACAGDELRLALHFDRRRIDELAACEILGHVKALLNRVAEDPNLRLHDLRSFGENRRLGRHIMLATETVLPARHTGRHEAPRTFKERFLAGIWEDVLGLTGPGINDDFFDLGGDSLLMMKMLALAHREFGRPLLVREMMEHRTIAGLAALLEEERSSTTESSSYGEALTDAYDWPPQGLFFSRQRLEELIEKGIEAPVNAAAISYIPEWLPAHTGLSRETIVREWYGNAPFMSRIISIPHGRIAAIILPLFGDELYIERLALQSLVDEAITMSAMLGARAVSLAGLIPSAMNYGRDMKRAAENNDARPIVTTGHGATASAVVLSTRQSLETLGRDMGMERLAFLGLGSIGSSVLRLMLQALPHPQSIILCDVPARLQDLNGFPSDGDFTGSSLLAPFRGAVPAEVYGATVIIGATNAPDVLILDRCAPGTLIVDDSGPHCFSVKDALRRFEHKGDILCMEGGLLEGPADLMQLSYLPPPAHECLDRSSILRLTHFNGRSITGCVLSSLLTACHGGPSTIGLPDSQHCMAWLKLLQRMGYAAPRPRLGLYVYAPADLERFRWNTAPRSYATGRGHEEARSASRERSIEATEDMTIPEEAGLRRVTIDFNDTARDYPRNRCVHDLFIEEAARTPEAVALIQGSERMTYGELNTLTDDLAQHLISRRVRPGDVVAVSMPRSLRMVVAFLAVLKAGAAYLPQDLSNPPERLVFQMKDAGARLLLRSGPTGERAPTGIEIVDVIEPVSETGPLPGREHQPAGADDLAYIMYTSGTSGQPKGVDVSHRGIVRLVRNTDYFNVTPGDVFMNLSLPGFDMSTFDLWAPLLNGACCALYPDEEMDLASLAEELRRNKVTIINMIPSLFNIIIDSCPAAFRGVQQILNGGEVMSVTHTRRARELYPGMRLINAYGPTECTVLACCYDVPQSLPPGLERVPIGHPIANTRAYVVDEHLRPQAIGIRGELCLAGDGLARGYRNLPELTAEYFIVAPMGPAGLERLYRTGDTCRWLPDGNLEFLGRRDRQVKLRGYRIELDEIETLLRQHSSIQEAVVILRDEAPGPCIVAYVEPRTQAMPRVMDLDSHLSRLLPKYMMPSAVIIAERLPRMLNGKLDRNALQSAALSEYASAEESEIS
jgi:amino acid adenylation domain-containing protein